MSCIASAQEQKENVEPQRKKVGVVLSGGGAKGMAHIGVLKVLDLGRLAVLRESRLTHVILWGCLEIQRSHIIEQKADTAAKYAPCG